MADVSDVLDTLCGLIVGLVYPNGTGNPSALGTPVKVYPGWPDPQTLASDLAAPAAQALHVSVFSTPSERNTTRYLPRWVQTVDPVTTIEVTVMGQSVYLAGTVTSPQNLAIVVNRRAFLYAVQPGDTLAGIAASFAAAINPFTPATASGAVITVPKGSGLVCAVGGFATIGREARRSEKVFQIGLWADNPANRSGLAKIIDPVLSDLTFIALPDGFAGRLRYKSSTDNDADQKQGIYRRDLFYTVEWGTGPSQSAAQIVAVKLNLQDIAGDLIESIDVGQTTLIDGQLDFSEPDNSGLIPGL